MRVRQSVSKKPVSVKKTSAPVYQADVEDEHEEAEARRLLDPEVLAEKPAKSKKPKQKVVMLQKAARKTGPGKGPSDKPARDNLKIPNKTVRRFALRSGSVRCAPDVYPLANETMHKTIDEVVLMAMRSATHDGRLTLKSRDVKRAMRVMNIRLY